MSTENPIEGYVDLNAEQVVAKLEGLDDEQLSAVEEAENSRSTPRKTVQRAIAEQRSASAEGSSSAPPSEERDIPASPVTAKAVDALENSDDIPNRENPENTGEKSAEAAAERAALLQDNPDDEPYTGYRAQSKEQILANLSNADVVLLHRIKAFEESNEDRNHIVEGVDERLSEVHPVLQGEMFYTADPVKQTEIADLVKEIRKSADSEEAADRKVQAAGLSNAEYLKERDNTEAAQYQESATSANVDDLGHRISMSETSAALRRDEERPVLTDESTSMHQRASLEADRGSPALEADSEALLKARYIATEKARDEAKKYAKALARKLDGQLSSEGSEDTPDAPGTRQVLDSGDAFGEWELADVDPNDESIPHGLGITQVGAAVTLRGEPADTQLIGVVIDTDRDQPDSGLVQVAFGTGSGWYNLNNLRYEAPAVELVEARA